MPVIKLKIGNVNQVAESRPEMNLVDQGNREHTTRSWASIIISILFISLLVVATSRASSALQKQDAPFDALVSDARSLWQKGQKREAVEKMKSAIAIDPGKPKIHLELAGMYVQLGETEKAQTAVADAITADPNPRPTAINRLLYGAINDASVDEFAAVLPHVPDEKRDELLLYIVSQRNAPPVDMVRLLIDKGARVNQKVTYKTALMHAAGEGHTEIVKLLLARGAQVNELTGEGNALMLAARAGRTEIVSLLLAAGAEVNAKNRLGNTALIMTAGPSIREMNPPPGGPPILPDSEIMELLLAKGADANARGQFGRTALMDANSVAKVKLLVAHTADANIKDEQGQTALMHAVRRGEVEVVSALVKSGADASIRDAKGATALMHALQPVDSYSGAEAKKMEKRRIDAARALLLVDSGDVNVQNEYGETLLMRAVNLGETEIVKLLIARGANVNLNDILGNTASVLAYEKDLTEIEGLVKTASVTPSMLNAFLRAAISKKDSVKVREFLAAGANANLEYAIDYTHQDIKRTALILAVQAGDPAIVEMLLAKGANVNARGLLYGSEHGLKYGTALEAAESSKNSAVINLLRKASP